MGRALPSNEIRSHIADEIFAELEALRDKAKNSGLPEIQDEIQKVLSGSLNAHVAKLYASLELRGHLRAS